MAEERQIEVVASKPKFLLFNNVKIKTKYNFKRRVLTLYLDISDFLTELIMLFIYMQRSLLTLFKTLRKSEHDARTLSFKHYLILILIESSKRAGFEEPLTLHFLSHKSATSCQIPGGTPC